MLMRTIMGGGRDRRDQFYREGIPSLGALTAGSITQDTAVRIAAIHACISLLADTVSTLPIGTFIRQNGARIPVERPGWLDAPVPDDPSITRVDHFSQVMWSLALDGNSFTLALPNVYDPAELRVVNPQRTVVKRGARYELSLDGGGRETVGPDQMVHIARSRRPGELRGMSPVEEAGTTFAMKRAADVFSERIFRQGIFLTGQMLLPGPADTTVIEQLRDEIAKQYAGTMNAGKPGIFANGAKWDVPKLNLQEMQLIELHKYAKLEAAGLWRIPPYLIGVTDPGAMAYASVEAQGSDLEKYTVRPYVERIEAGYQRLVPGSSQTFLKINTDGLLRADFKTRWEGYQIALQNKAAKIDEVRAREDWPPFGESGGGGFLETPNNNAPVEPVARRSDDDERERRHAEVITVLSHREAPAVNVTPTIHNHVAPAEVRMEPTVVNVTTPEVRVEVPEQATPIVNVHPEVRAEAPIINPVVTVTGPPVVVNTPDTLRITEMPARRTVRQVTKRNDRGSIAETVDIESDTKE